jgi:hypothetical protein
MLAKEHHVRHGVAAQAIEQAEAQAKEAEAKGEPKKPRVHQNVAVDPTLKLCLMEILGSTKETVLVRAWTWWSIGGVLRRLHEKLWSERGASFKHPPHTQLRNLHPKELDGPVSLEEEEARHLGELAVLWPSGIMTHRKLKQHHDNHIEREKRKAEAAKGEWEPAGIHAYSASLSCACESRSVGNPPTVLMLCSPA